jgi:ABC-type branched-subunit amino acid transport system ATPase component
LTKGERFLERRPEDNVLLNVRGLSKHFGGIKAVDRVTFAIEKGSIISMIGPNGAGKSTVINVVSGIYAPDEGKVHFQGEGIAGIPAHEIATKGIGRTFQLEELFGSLSVLENVMVGCHTGSRSDVLACGFSLSSARSEEKHVRDEAMECLKEVGLEQRAHDPISRLPLGERKLVGVARALAMKPKLLMLDEPAGGRASHEVERLVHLIYALRDQGITLFIVEHNMPFVMSLSERVIVLDEGCKIAEGTPDEVRTSKAVIEAYLGEEVC